MKHHNINNDCNNLINMYLFLKSFCYKKTDNSDTKLCIEYIDKIINKENVDECIKNKIFKIQTN